ncbi:MAG: class I SAM-dependent methyltransferase [Litorimonas sp.]
MTDISRSQGGLRSVTPLGIAAQEIAQLAARAEDGTIDALSLAADLKRLSDLVGGLDPYVEAVTTPESAALAALNARTAEEPWGERFGSGMSSVALEAEMLSGHVEGQFLRMLVRAMGARRVLEIGMFTGYGALAMAEALPDDGELVALELDPYVAEFAKPSFDNAAGRRIEVRVGPALETLRDMEGDAPFDFIFIDADKGGYADYLDAILDGGLLSETGLIGVDNTLLQGEPYLAERSPNGQAIADFNAKVAADPRVEQVLVPLRDGVTLIARKPGPAA